MMHSVHKIVAVISEPIKKSTEIASK